MTRSAKDANGEVVRRAAPTDAKAIGRLLHAFQLEFAEPSPGADWYAGRDAALLGDPTLMVLLAGAPQEEGIAVLRLRPSLYSDADEAYLAELYVVPERRGRGLGQALLAATVATARASGADTLNVNTSRTTWKLGRCTQSSGSPTARAAPTDR